MICQLCSERQPVNKICRKCEGEMGKYYCSKCKFWDHQGDTKGIFHCDKCGLCRIGGRDNYFHCDRCGACFHVDGDHSGCRPGNFMDNCPVCLEPLFSTRDPAVPFEGCRHYIHSSCYKKYMGTLDIHSTRCPICFHSTYKDENRKQLIGQLRDIIEMPPGWRYNEYIYCNNCHHVNEVEHHIAGQICPMCDSSNVRLAKKSDYDTQEIRKREKEAANRQNIGNC